MIVNGGWLEASYPILDKKKWHRKKIETVDLIGKLKTKIIEKIGFISMFFFLTQFYGKQDHCAPFRNVEKAVLLIWQLISGKSCEQMGDYISSSTFFNLYDEFYKDGYKNLNNWLNLCLKDMFSNHIIRVLSAKLYNSERFTFVTLMLDGHDHKISYENGDLEIHNLYSFKLRKSGVRTQVMMDINQYIISLSKSEPCGLNNDGTMFIDFRVDKQITQYDCLLMDGGYTQYIKPIVKKSQKEGGMINVHNFLTPFRKPKNEELSIEEFN